MSSKPIMPKEIHLRPWFECVGRFLRFEINELEVSVVLSCGDKHFVVSYPKHSLESEILRKKLSGCKLGTKIALMKTDEASRPLLVRIIGT